MILLTIGIPTWNRSKELIECLNSINSQLHGNTNLINCTEILISNNASTDNTKSKVLNYSSQYPDLNITYVEHLKNIGFDRNVDNIFKKAKGKYVWTLSDDDLLKENSIKLLLEYLFNFKK